MASIPPRGLRAGASILAPMRLPVLNFIDDKLGKPVGIEQRIGRRATGGKGSHRRRDRCATVAASTPKP